MIDSTERFSPRVQVAGTYRTPWPGPRRGAAGKSFALRALVLLAFLACVATGLDLGPDATRSHVHDAVDRVPIIGQLNEAIRDFASGSPAGLSR